MGSRPLRFDSWDGFADCSIVEIAEKAWEDCWPDEPSVGVYGDRDISYKLRYRRWLIEVLTYIVNGYDGQLCDLVDHIADFADKWIDERSFALESEAQEAAASARINSHIDSRYDDDFQ